MKPGQLSKVLNVKILNLLTLLIISYNVEVDCWLIITRSIKSWIFQGIIELHTTLETWNIFRKYVFKTYQDTTHELLNKWLIKNSHGILKYVSTLMTTFIYILNPYSHTPVYHSSLICNFHPPPPHTHTYTRTT